MQNDDDLYRPLFDPQQLTKLWQKKKHKPTTNIRTKIRRTNQLVKEFDQKKAEADKLDEMMNKTLGNIFKEARELDKRIKNAEVPTYEDLKQFHNISKKIEDL